MIMWLPVCLITNQPSFLSSLISSLDFISKGNKFITSSKPEFFSNQPLTVDSLLFLLARGLFHKIKMNILLKRLPERGHCGLNEKNQSIG